MSHMVEHVPNIQVTGSITSTERKRTKQNIKWKTLRIVPVTHQMLNKYWL
jgi:hypothetical protein